MKEITRKQFMGGMAATVALGWRGTFAAPARMQRNYLDMTWWDPYVEDITDVDTYLRRKFRQDVTDKTTGVGVAALKKILAEIVAAGKAGARSRLLAAEAYLSTRHPGGGTTTGGSEGEQEVNALFIPGTRYRKTGVVFFGLEKVGSARQLDLFSPVEKAEASPLYKAIDSLNKRYGKGKVFSAAEGLGDRSWKMKRGKLSKRPTTRWDELMVMR